MKKLLILLIASVGITLAAPKTFTSLSNCLWSLMGDGGIVANSVSIAPSGTIYNGQYFGDSPFNILTGFSYLSAGDSAAKRITLDVVDSPDWNAGTGSMVESVKSGDNYASRVFLYGFNGADYSEAALDAGSSGGSSLRLADDYGTATLSPLYGVRAGGTEAWKLGSVTPATVQLVTDRYVQVEIGGQIIKLAVVE